MIQTLEARWFRPGVLPASVRAWFDALAADGRGQMSPPEHRADWYLVPAESDGLGLKHRGGRLEVKQRVGGAEHSRWGGAAEGLVEAWRKWSYRLAEDAPGEAGWVEVVKARRLLHVPAASDGGCCTLELGTVAVDGRPWWTVCLEAEGPSVPARREALRAAAARWITPGLPVHLGVADAGGYPAWLRRAARG
ncbi:MAG: hypothetical protein ACK41D_04980 [Rubricoccaceae bacterium]